MKGRGSRLAAGLLILLTSGPMAVAAADPGPTSPAEAAARDAAVAADQLRAALGGMDQALTATDQVVALTGIIRAYETGLAALRDGLRRASLREAEIRARFDARRDRLGRVLGVMATMQQSPETALLLHPAGPVSTARSGMILNAVAPALQAEADELRAGLDEIATVRALETSAANTLTEGLRQVQEARRLLASAVSDRSSVPVRFGSDPEELRTLVESVDTLDAFANGVVGMEQDVGAPMADFEAAQGSLPLPVMGEVLRGYDEPDAAGVERPGLTIATAPSALVTTPWPATIRYRGPLLDYGNVMIVEPARDYLLVLAGLDQVFGEIGDVLAAGEPLGLMGGKDSVATEFGLAPATASATGNPSGLTETLYVELRQGKETLDPSDWFVMNPVVGQSDQIRTSE
ncbi:peptidase M23 [uncultured Paracoccus sp.]|uniref:murein hydrolase activator EnvC family protein n=1 Tax=uncultured Paracoccus sp. TaxID=189685 RepID=UPI002625A5FF|nr:peptidase M23 [uncultured Paracoccus sp.]